MRSFLIFVGILLISAQWTSSVSADAVISGPACVIDGNTLQVGGKVKNRKCWGGIDVRLHGSIAPNLNETCTDTGGNAWDCGKNAKDVLAGLIRRHSVSCYHLDGEFEDRIPIVTCVSGRTDLALELVVLGMAKALHDKSKRYELEEKDAKQAKRGLWK